MKQYRIYYTYFDTYDIEIEDKTDNITLRIDDLDYDTIEQIVDFLEKNNYCYVEED